MVDVVSVCESTQRDATYWPVVFVVLFASFLSVDVGLTAYALWKGVKTVAQKA